MARKKPRREISRSSNKGWSDWSTAMVPSRMRGVTKSRAPGNNGYILRDTETAFPYEAQRCGIYELNAEKGEKSAVVYVGSTCRKKPGALHDRINEYIRDGSHKSRLINGALRREYTLKVRVKVADSNKKAEELENARLKKYDYAWNKRKNGSKRYILR